MAKEKPYKPKVLKEKIKKKEERKEEVKKKTPERIYILPEFKRDQFNEVKFKKNKKHKRARLSNVSKAG